MASKNARSPGSTVAARRTSVIPIRFATSAPDIGFSYSGHDRTSFRSAKAAVEGRTFD